MLALVSHDFLTFMYSPVVQFIHVEQDFAQVSELPSSWWPASPGQCLGAEISTGSQEIDSCTDSNRFLESEGPEVLWYDIESFYPHSSRWRKWKGVFKFVVKLLVSTL